MSDLFSSAGDDQLRQDEGRRETAYPDPLSGGEPFTCGIGCTGSDIGPHTVWTDEEIEGRYALAKRETAAFLDRNLPWWAALDPVRRDVVFNMAYQLRGRLLGFHKLLDYARRGAYAAAADEMLDSAWARQVPKRAKRLSAQMRGGVR